MRGIALNFCCHLTEPFRLVYAKHPNGLSLFLRIRGNNVRPLGYLDPGSKGNGETAKKCLEAGLSLEETVKLVPPPAGFLDRMNNFMKKEAPHVVGQGV